MSTAEDHGVFAGAGEMAALMRARDWSDTPLGPPDAWSPSLKTVIRLMLGSRYAMWMGWGPDLLFFYNDAYRQPTLGTKHPRALGKPAREVWAEIWDAVGPRIDHVLSTGEGTLDDGLLLFLQRNGYREETYFSFSYSVVPGDDGGRAGLFCVVVEETERILGERRISLLRDLASLLAGARTRAEAFAALEPCLRDGRLLPFAIAYAVVEDRRVNRVALSGLDVDHAGAPGSIDLDVPEVPWPIRRVLDEGQPLIAALPPDMEWPRSDDRDPPTQALILPLLQQGDEGAPGVLIAGINPNRPFDQAAEDFLGLLVGQLAAAVAAADAYAAAQERAQGLIELDRAKTAFFSNVSHEFRTPLTLMLGPTESALASPERALRGEDLKTVHRNALRLLKLVNTLLSFSRIEAGRAEASFTPTDLAALTADLASAFRSAMQSAGLAFEVECEGSGELALIDRDMWEKIVLNLLSNAFKFTLTGSVRLSLRREDDRIVLVVSDTGVGIPTHELTRVFERFHRIEGTRGRSHEGSGIGLALVRDLVRMHQGDITVESELGLGTTFRVWIPVSAPPSVGAAAPPATVVTESGSTHAAAFVAEAMRWLPGSEVEATPGADSTWSTSPLTPRATVLVVDDNADMRDYVARLLRRHWTVETATDGVDALERIAETVPDLVIADVMMPRMDGSELVRRLRENLRTATLPILLLSARAGEEAIAEGLRTGADDYLVKPFAASALLVRVETQLVLAQARKEARIAVETERARLFSMFVEAPAAICMIAGDDLVVELANPACLKAWGKDASIIGLPLLAGLPELEGQGFDELLREVMRSGKTFRSSEARATILRPGADAPVDVYFDYAYVPIHEVDGRVTGVFVFAYDVTALVAARKDAETSARDAERARGEAEATNRIKDEFLATTSHELRTPLNAILGWASLARSNLDNRVMVTRGLETIERNARTQARLVEDVLEVSRIITGKLLLEIGRVELAVVLHAAVDVVRPAAEAKLIDLSLDLDEELGAVAGDAGRLQQVVWNLLSNAVKFTPARGHVHLSAHRVDGEVVILVRDDGVGIPAEHLPHVFERFRQVDGSTTRRHGGLGLGLAIVRHLAEMHGGSVRVASEGEGRGATFHVHLPVRAVAASAVPPALPGPAQRPRSVAEPVRVLAGLRILVVDDDEDSRQVVVTSLEAAGARVEAASSAAAALEVVALGGLDLLITDIGMPDVDGFSLLRQVRALHADLGGTTPAIALTAYARRTDEEASLAAGFQHHLAKPVDPRTLVEVAMSVARPR